MEELCKRSVIVSEGEPRRCPEDYSRVQTLVDPSNVTFTPDLDTDVPPPIPSVSIKVD